MIKFTMCKFISNVINNENFKSDESVVVKENSTMKLYTLSNGIELVSKLSAGEMLIALRRIEGDYLKIRV